MRKVAIVFAYLASAGHGRRVQTGTARLLQHSSLHESRTSTLGAAFNPCRTQLHLGSMAFASPRTVDLDTRKRLTNCMAMRSINRSSTIATMSIDSIVANADLMGVGAGQDRASSKPPGVAVGVEHEALLPEAYRSRIPAADEQILNFLLAFLENEGFGHAPLFVNGGYIRDLLLGGDPEDLDLSICLRDFPDEVTVEGLLEHLPEFAEQHPELGIVRVELATILANEAKTKMLDAFKSFLINDNGQRIEVDVMPTIGDETYEEGSRTPIRDHRGSPEQDALRRDLTVGAMLVQVERGSGGRLSYRVFDFYGGLADLRAGVLRAPYPPGKTYQEVAAGVLQSRTDEGLAQDLALSRRPDEEAVQILWWAKLLIDDPVRACRALRFQTKLHGFTIHNAFWDAMTFAVGPMSASVAGSRKNTEFVKLAGAGSKACTDFMEIAFTRTFGPGSQLRLAPALFGGLPASGPAKILSEVHDFDTKEFRNLANVFASEDEGSSLMPEELLGGLLAAAITSAVGLEGSPLDEFETACDGLETSKQMRRAGVTPLQLASFWVSEQRPPDCLDSAFADACGVSAESMRLYAEVWHNFSLPGSPQQPAWPLQRRELALRLARRFAKQRGVSNNDVLEKLPEAMEIVQRVRPGISGSVLNTPGILSVPYILVGRIIGLLHIALRILDYNEPLQNGEDLQALFLRFPRIQAALSQSILDTLLLAEKEKGSDASDKGGKKRKFDSSEESFKLIAKEMMQIGLVKESSGEFVAKAVPLLRIQMNELTELPVLMKRWLGYPLKKTLQSKACKQWLEDGSFLETAKLVIEANRNGMLENLGRDKEVLESLRQHIGEVRGVKRMKLMVPIRICLTGTVAGPDMNAHFDLLNSIDANVAWEHVPLSARLDQLVTDIEALA